LRRCLPILVLLSGCTGADFTVPAVSQAEVDRAALSVKYLNESSLPKYARTAVEEKAMLNRVAAQLRYASPPLCQYAKVANCAFQAEYSSDDEPNAYAEGETRVVVNHGLLQYLKTDDEVAAVVGHEFGHHIANHIEEKQDNVRLGAVLGAIVGVGTVVAAGGTSDPNAGDVVNSSTRVGAQVGALSYSKEEEREADLLAAYLLARAGYDLEQAGNLWRVLAALGGDSGPGIFATHPSDAERMAAWQKSIVIVENSPDKLPDWKQ
jgi:predicted Zn-dependent protease